MTKDYKVLVSLVVCGCVVVGSSLAQSAGERGDPVKFSVAADVLGTDNRDSSSTEESNFDFFIRPRIDIISDTERTIFDFYYEPSLRQRSNPASDQDESSFYHDLGLNLKHLLTPATVVNLSDHYLFTDDPSADPEGITLRRDSNYQINRASGDISVEMSELTMMQVGGGHMMRKYKEDDVAREADEEMMNGNVMLARSLAETLSIFVTGGGTSVDYGSDGNSDRGYTSINGGVGVNRVFSQFAKGSAGAGLTSLEYDDDNISSDSSPYFDASLEVSTAAKTKLVVSGRYSLRDSDVFPYSSQKSTELYSRLEWKSTESLTLAAWGQYRLGEYDGANIPSQVLRDAGVSSASQYMSLRGRDATGDDTTIVIGAEAAYSIDENTSIRLAQSYEDVTSDVDTSFTRNSTRLVLKRTF